MAKIVQDPTQPMPPEQSGLAKALMLPGKYEVTEADTFTIEIWTKKIDNRWLVVNKGTVGAEQHEVTCRMWSFDEEVTFRRMALQYDQEKRIHFVDNNLLDQIKLRRLLKSWTFEQDNPNLKLLHVNGVMSDQSWDAVRKLHRNILTFIIAKMNEVLDGGE